MNDHCVEALITIPFELPTLLFFHGLKLYAKENKSGNGHSLAQRLCETELLVDLARDGHWQSAGWPQDGAAN